MLVMRTLTSVVLFFALTQPLLAAAPVLEVVADRPDALYKQGETVTFRVSAKSDGKPLVGEKIDYVITKDGIGNLATGTITSANEPVVVQAKLDEPGVIRCDAKSKPAAATQPISAVAGAAVDPEKIGVSLPVPEDFDAFWEKQKELLATSAPEVKLTPVDSKDPAVVAFDVQITCPGGAPVSGYLALPKDAKPKSLGAILYPHSAGVRDSDLPHAVRGAKLGLIALDFNAHGLPNAQGDAFYKDKYDNALRGYSARGIDDRDNVYFRGMYLRLLRALDYLTTRPEWDGKTLIVEGSSQGGGQALVAAGLDPRVTLCIASVPAMCDHTGFLANRAAGWPRIVPKDPTGKYDEKATQVARYIDAMNFATRIKCPTWITVGYIDKVCPATSVYAAYNAIPAGVEKHIIARPAMGHAFPKDLIEQFDEMIRKGLAATQP